MHAVHIVDTVLDAREGEAAQSADRGEHVVVREAGTDDTETGVGVDDLRKRAGGQEKLTGGSPVPLVVEQRKRCQPGKLTWTQVRCADQATAGFRCRRPARPT